MAAGHFAVVWKKRITPVLLFLAALAEGLNYLYPHAYLRKTVYTFVGWAVLHLLFNRAVRSSLLHALSKMKSKYYLRKIASVLYYFGVVLLVVVVWVPNVQGIIVGAGLFGAAVAVGLQDIFKNLAGGILVLTRDIYRVGDRIEIEGKYGDVVDISFLYTTIMEIKGWVAGDQETGRLSIVPNGLVLSNAIHTYTKDHNFLWDEIVIPITYDSDWRLAEKKFLEVVDRETEEMRELSRGEMETMKRKYFIVPRSLEPEIFLKLTDNWVELKIRFVGPVKGRRRFKSKISRELLEEVEKSKGKIEVASATSHVSIKEFPTMEFKE